MEWWFSSHQQPTTLSLYTLSRPIMASNDNNKHKVEEEVESSVIVKKRLRLSDDDDDSSGESQEEVSSEESMNQPDSSEEKLMCKHACGSDDGNTSSMESELRSPETLSSHVCTDPDGGGDDNDDFDDFLMYIDP
jgi:hypothetical protein